MIKKLFEALRSWINSLSLSDEKPQEEPSQDFEDYEGEILAPESYVVFPGGGELV